MSSHGWLYPERFYFTFERQVNFQKNNQSSTNALMARQERDFSHLSAFFPFERKVSAIWARGEHLKCDHHFSGWAPKLRLPLFGVFDCDLSAKIARRERDQVAFECEMSAKICVILPFCRFKIYLQNINLENPWKVTFPCLLKLL